MKKFLALMLCLAMLCPVAFAKSEGSQADITPVVNYKYNGAGSLTYEATGTGIVSTLLASTTLNADPTSVTSTAFATLDYDKIAVIVAYDETEVGESISGAVTMEISFDNSVWFSASFYDYAGGATLQTSETISADGSYYLWMNKDIVAPYVRVKIVATGTDADDVLVVSAKIVGRR